MRDEAPTYLGGMTPPSRTTPVPELLKVWARTICRGFPGKTVPLVAWWVRYEESGEGPTPEPRDRMSRHPTVGRMRSGERYCVGLLKKRCSAPNRKPRRLRALC